MSPSPLRARLPTAMAQSCEQAGNKRTTKTNRPPPLDPFSSPKSDYQSTTIRCNGARPNGRSIFGQNPGARTTAASIGQLILIKAPCTPAPPPEATRSVANGAAEGALRQRRFIGLPHPPSAFVAGEKRRDVPKGEQKGCHARAAGRANSISANETPSPSPTALAMIDRFELGKGPNSDRLEGEELYPRRLHNDEIRGPKLEASGIRTVLERNLTFPV
uniref:Uncharacterized protein n=1 Tax=Trichuris muris TaxID=70415 RepID=A0A5S6QCS6_TRIMR